MVDIVPYSGTWTQWTTSTASTTASNIYIKTWNEWNTTSTITYKAVYQPRDYESFEPYVVPRATPEQIAAAEQRAVEVAQRARERQAALDAGRVRAEELLRAHLTEAQRDELERLNRFTVIAADGQEYRVYRSWAGNIRRVEQRGTVKREVEELCVHPRTRVPTEDSMLAQKLMLETIPEELRRIANVSRIA